MNYGYGYGLARVAIVLILALVCLPTQASGKEVDEEAAEAPTHQGFKLGDFSIKDFRPLDREKVKLMFTLYVEVEEGQREHFEKLWGNYEHRVRDQVITAARLIPSLEFDDPQLHALRRRIYLRLRRSMPELRIERVFVSDFSYLVD